MISPLSISFEFFPAKTPQGVENLRLAATNLAGCSPDFFSVTFGALGSTRSGTIEAVQMVKEITGAEVAPHISCIGSSKEELIRLLEQYQAENVKRLVVLRGDIPENQTNESSELRFASDLVQLVREKTGDSFHIEVAAYPEFHPEAESTQADIQNLKRKYVAGANSAITQYFFNPDAYFYLLDDCASQGINMPIVPGIMPITQFASLARFSDRCGAEIPMWIRKRLQSYGDDIISIQQFGVEVVVKLCQRLIAGGAPGLHFYTLNRHEACLEVIKHLRLAGSLTQQPAPVS